MQERTIRDIVKIKGRGLHTGNQTFLRLIPADRGGIRFSVDGTEIKADIKNVASTFHRIVLSDKGKSVSTVEHLLSVLFAFRITHIICEVKGGEIPAMDGSALPFVNYIMEEGLEDLDREIPMRKFPSVHFNKNGTEMFYMPSDDTYVFSQISYDNPFLSYQYNGFFIKRYLFTGRIAPARTFTLKERIPDLRKKGLIKGGTASNAVIIGKDGKTNKLRFEDEPVRHKILDFLGDLCLLGTNIEGRFFLINAGHEDHIKFLKMLLKEEKK